jgi:fatty-acyl-CoA synthase
MFISGGENIYPTEIEHVLYKHPAVEMCAVVGMPDPKWGELGKAFVVIKAGQKVTQEELMAHMQHFLAGYKVPRTIEFRESLPISAAGKILKRELINPHGEAAHES